MKIKKIFGSFNFMGNRLKNFKVDTPTQDEHPTTKKYTDDLNKFDTESSSEDSEKFPWVTDVENKPIKEVLDKLIYPIIYPEFKELNFLNVRVESLETYLPKNSENNNLNLFTDVLNQLKFEFRLKLNDRVSNAIPMIRFTDTDGIISSVNCELSNGKYSATVNLIIDKIDKVELVLDVLPSAPKRDSEGNNYTDSNFSVAKQISQDITEAFKNKINSFKAIRIYSSDEYEAINDYYNDIPNSGELIMHDIDYSLIKNLIALTVNTDSQGLKHQKYIIFIDKNIVDNFNINFLGYTGNIEDLTTSHKTNLLVKNDDEEIQGIYNVYLFEISTILNILKIKFI